METYSWRIETTTEVEKFIDILKYIAKEEEYTVNSFINTTLEQLIIMVMAEARVYDLFKDIDIDITKYELDIHEVNRLLDVMEVFLTTKADIIPYLMEISVQYRYGEIIILINEDEEQFT